MASTGSKVWSPADIKAQSGAMTYTGRRTARTSSIEYTPSESVGEKPKLLYVHKDELYVPGEFQRLVAPWHVGEILSKFDYGYVHVVHTGPKEERGYPIIDGQHEWLAALRHPMVDEMPIAVAWWATTRAQQADIFVKLNLNRINITTTGIFYARLAQGDDEAVWMDSVLTDAGCKMSRVMTGNLPPLTTCAIGTLKKLRPLDLWLRQALELMAQAWPSQGSAFQGPIIEGVTKFIGIHHKSGLDFDRLRNVLTRLSAGAEATKGRANSKVLGQAAWEYIIDLLTAHYNLRLPEAKQLARTKWSASRMPTQ